MLLQVVVSPGGTKTTRTTTTYTVRSVPGSSPGEGAPIFSASVEGGTVEELKKYIEDTRNKLLEDPRTKQMIEQGEVSWQKEE